MAATNCLNFGNPQKPEIMAQLSTAIDGIGEACIALGTPITGGNVSLYNETRGEGIYPTPVIGIVGIIEDVTKAVGSDFTQAGDAIILLQPVTAGSSGTEREFGSSSFAKHILKGLWGAPPQLDLAQEASLHKVLAQLAEENLIHSARDISDGGIAVALAEASFARGNRGQGGCVARFRAARSAQALLRGRYLRSHHLFEGSSASDRSDC